MFPAEWECDHAVWGADHFTFEGLGGGGGVEVGDFEKKNTKVQIVYPENCNPITLFAENVLTERYN